MKTPAFITLILFLILTKLAAQEVSLKLYSIKSGIIEYSFSGDKVGKGTLYFDDYGTRSAMYTDVVQNGEKTRTWVVTSGEYQYIWNPDYPVKGMRLKNPFIDWLAGTSPSDVNCFTESIFSKMGFEKAPDEIFFDKNCQVMKSNIGKVLTWNGILMLADTQVAEHMSHQEVTRIQADVPVAGKYFIVPKNVVFSELPGF